MIFDENARPLVAIHECWNESEAQVIASVLRLWDIEARLNSEVPHSIMPITADGLGRIEVLVGEDVAKNARAIVEAYREEGEGKAG